MTTWFYLCIPICFPSTTYILRFLLPSGTFDGRNLKSHIVSTGDGHVNGRRDDDVVGAIDDNINDEDMSIVGRTYSPLHSQQPCVHLTGDVTASDNDLTGNLSVPPLCTRRSPHHRSRDVSFSGTYSPLPNKHQKHHLTGNLTVPVNNLTANLTEPADNPPVWG